MANTAALIIGTVLRRPKDAEDRGRRIAVLLLLLGLELADAWRATKADKK
jgi:hypothetical protein